MRRPTHGGYPTPQEASKPVGDEWEATGCTHELKTDPVVFHAVFEGRKTFEIRYNVDRDFQVGDTLVLRETEFSGFQMTKDGGGWPLRYTGRTITKTVSHVLGGYGLAEGWVCLSFAAALAPEVEEASKGEAVASDAELARVAYKGFDDYWTEDCPGKDAEAWAASAKAVLAEFAHPSQQALSDEAVDLLWLEHRPPGTSNEEQYKCARNFARAILAAAGGVDQKP